ncbi:uncharacterized protein LOC111784031 [Cucurbita pepo subsp. pepo]|uniref:uncharacterized protein LOC111784031 n=1 Tax=Cucurbita pepo subsp. pepo TaxID=3664 RepID=UPI000C9D85A3|nr:uncharacterized protein LOC111784031 [Cucurbita pepo subsp. pepo]
MDAGGSECEKTKLLIKRVWMCSSGRIRGEYWRSSLGWRNMYSFQTLRLRSSQENKIWIPASCISRSLYWWLSPWIKFRCFHWEYNYQGRNSANIMQQRSMYLASSLCSHGTLMEVLDLGLQLFTSMQSIDDSGGEVLGRTE